MYTSENNTMNKLNQAQSECRPFSTLTALNVLRRTLPPGVHE